MKQYHIALPNGTRQGPFPEEYVLDMFAKGMYPADTLVWTQGMPQRAPITTIAAAKAYPMSMPAVNAPLPEASLATNPAFGNPFSALWHACTHRSYSGRACRKEYWMAMLGAIMLMLGSMALIYFMLLPISGTHAEAGPETDLLATAATILCIVWAVVVLAFNILVSLPLTCRRLHDIGLSGWWQLIQYLPFVSTVGGLVLLIMTIIDGNPGVNRYGADPKGR